MHDSMEGRYGWLPSGVVCTIEFSLFMAVFPCSLCRTTSMVKEAVNLWQLIRRQYGGAGKKLLLKEAKSHKRTIKKKSSSSSLCDRNKSNQFMDRPSFSAFTFQTGSLDHTNQSSVVGTNATLV
jgi:hypothetical protein